MELSIPFTPSVTLEILTTDEVGDKAAEMYVECNGQLLHHIPVPRDCQAQSKSHPSCTPNGGCP